MKRSRGRGENLLEKQETRVSGGTRKKRKRAVEDPATTPESTKVAGGRQYTVSIALPGSIIDNAQTHELKTYLAGQIARAAVVFCVDEVVVFDESGSSGSSTCSETPSHTNHKSDPNAFLCHVLQYLETPQYLRKSLFPMHRDLKYVGLLNPLDSPHHMRVDEACEYREGVVLGEEGEEGEGEGEEAHKGKKKKKEKEKCLVDCGMRKSVAIDKQLKSGTRVTVNIQKLTKKEKKPHKGVVVAPSTPRVKVGSYWGYTVRHADSLGAVFTECSYKGGYDLTIGTSERGRSVDEVESIPHFKHVLVVFGGVRGLEHSLERDRVLGGEVEEVSLLFHLYLNTCPQQGSRTIRTEEAVPITLSALRPHIKKAGLLI